MRRTIPLLTFFVFLVATVMVFARTPSGVTTPMLGGTGRLIPPGTAQQILTLQVEG
jgi:hypothetical protein